MQHPAAHVDAYRQVDVQTASQGKLIVMLFNGAIQRAEEAKRQLGGRNVQSIHDNLMRAQEILTELRGALDFSVGEIAYNLDRIYEYIIYLLIQSNIRKDAATLEEAIDHLTIMRDTWQEAFAKSPEAAPRRTVSMDRHGAAIMNLTG